MRRRVWLHFASLRISPKLPRTHEKTEQTWLWKNHPRRRREGEKGWRKPYFAKIVGSVFDPNHFLRSKNKLSITAIILSVVCVCKKSTHHTHTRFPPIPNIVKAPIFATLFSRNACAHSQHAVDWLRDRKKKRSFRKCLTRSDL